MTLSLWQLTLVPWYAFPVYFGISALRVKPTKIGEDPAKRLMHVVPLVLAAFLLFSRGLRFGALGERFVPPIAAVAYGGIALTFLGAAFALWARYCLGEYWSSRVTLKVDHRIIRNGPYAYIRHPLYTGMLTAIAGTALVLGEWRGVIALLLALGAFWRKASTEEALLSSEFGDQYAEYRRQTGFLTPRFH
jgi:protein-S-isoprenylcysteine O-methyltransferase Ste14